ncbi:D-tyrosyl-tRNA deacylase [Zopfochytrium polystomum]|nr:D-tyrosyl-tRNA deacylase [Zopfochytrium polystomum]
MRAVIQRVKRASVTVDDRIVSSISHGICVLVGITVDDTEDDADYIAKKILNTRLWPSPATPSSPSKPWSLSVAAAQYEILSVSQFTLYATTSKGTKPDFHLAMKSDLSRAFYDRFLERLRRWYEAEKIKDGEFGAMMDVKIVNDGPVTILLDSRQRGGGGGGAGGGSTVRDS